MRIAFVLAGLGAGGAERVVSRVARHWVEQGHSVDIIAFDADDDPVFHDFDARVRLHRLGQAAKVAGVAGRSGPVRMLRRVARLRAALKAVQPDAVFSFLFKINIITLIAGRGLGLRIAVAERNHPRLQPAHPAWGLLRRLTYPGAAKLLLQTEASRAALPAALRAKGVVIANPIVAHPRRPEPDGQRQIAAVGRLDAQKGFDLLIDAFAQIAARHPDWTLTIWGEGPLRPTLQAEVARRGLAGRVLLPGLSRSPSAWIETASAFVLSSRYEGFANALAEAMAAGLPCVAFNCEYGVDLMVRNGVDGLLVADGNVNELAQAMDRLLSDGCLRAHLGDVAREGAVRFSERRILKDWDHALEGVTLWSLPTP